MDQIEAERGHTTEAALEAESRRAGAAAGSGGTGEQDARRSVMREKRQAAWRHLSLNERDVLTVLSAICKVSLCR